MVLKISDRFYEPYSFAIDFGHSSKQEIEYIKEIISKKGFSSTDSNVKSILNFVKELSPIVRAVNKDEINEINQIIIKEKITGGIIPTDISIAYHTASHLMDVVIYGLAGKDVIQMITGNDRISKLATKAVSRLKRSKGRSLIKKQLTKIKKWKKSKNIKSHTKSTEARKKKKIIRRKR